MSTQEDPEPGTPVAEESKKCHRNLRGKEDPKCWRKVAIFFGSVALCLLIALATSLGIFLSKELCMVMLVVWYVQCIYFQQLRHVFSMF